jgi:hypothetical protein
MIERDDNILRSRTLLRADLRAASPTPYLAEAHDRDRGCSGHCRRGSRTVQRTIDKDRRAMRTNERRLRIYEHAYVVRLVTRWATPTGAACLDRRIGAGGLRRASFGEAVGASLHP